MHSPPATGPAAKPLGRPPAARRFPESLPRPAPPRTVGALAFFGPVGVAAIIGRLKRRWVSLRPHKLASPVFPRNRR
jgi:hypothetical protein